MGGDQIEPRYKEFKYEPRAKPESRSCSVICAEDGANREQASFVKCSADAGALASASLGATITSVLHYSPEWGAPRRRNRTRTLNFETALQN
jgi:hypothetical protein